MHSFRKVVVGISGGVDSAVAALILKQKGFQVHGVFMQNWDIKDEVGACDDEKDYKDAEKVCRQLKIPFNNFNFVKEYWNYVFSDYENGKTPNPDILCNKYIKFNMFFKRARDILNADAIATGHYARNSFGCFLENYVHNRDAQLLQAKDSWKDQTFFLSNINQDALRRTMFPLGDMTKLQVKQIASRNGMSFLLRKKESMGICFIGPRNLKTFISDYVKNRNGKFVDIELGEIVGSHNGVHQWTLGQRCQISGKAYPYFVTKKIPHNNIIYVCRGRSHPSLFCKILYTEKIEWISKSPCERGDVQRCQFCFQHVDELVWCTIFENRNGHAIVLLDDDIYALTEGQHSVFYKDGVCLGGAKIAALGSSSFLLNWWKHNLYNNILSKDNKIN